MGLPLLIAANTLNAGVRIGVIATITNFYAGSGSDLFLVLLTGAYFSSAISDFGLRMRILSDSAAGLATSGSQFHNDILTYRMALAIVAVTGFLIWALGQPNLMGPDLLPAVLAMAVYGATLPVADVALGILRGEQRITLDAGIRITEGISTLTGVFLVGISDLPILWVALVLCAISASRQIVTAVLVKFRPFTNRYRLAGLVQQFRRNLFAGLSLFVMTAAQRMPILLAAALYQMDGVAPLAIAITLIISAQTISTSVSHYLVPRMVANGSLHSLPLFGRNLLLLGGVGIVCGAAVMVLHPLISLVFNVEFGIDFALIVAFALPLSMVHDFQRFFVTAISRERFFLPIQVVALTISVSLAMSDRIATSFANFGALYVVYLFLVVLISVPMIVVMLRNGSAEGRA